VLDAADPVALAKFYETLLGWTMTEGARPGAWSTRRGTGSACVVTTGRRKKSSQNPCGIRVLGL